MLAEIPYLGYSTLNKNVANCKSCTSELLAASGSLVEMNGECKCINVGK